MPALPTVVTSYLTAVKGALQQGSDLGQNVRGAAQNYLRAQDMATVLDLLQQALTTSTLTATAGTTQSVSDGAGTFAPGQQIGNRVTFTGNVTSALAGVTATVLANDDRTLTFTAALTAAPASGDTYTITGALVDSEISQLRQGKGLADSPAGSVYGDERLVRAALVKFIRQMNATLATGTLTLTGNAGDTETVVIGSKTYTFQTTLTDVDGNVDIGATASDSLDNLIAAITLGAGAGTAYATSTTLNTDVTAAAGGGDTMDVTARSLEGPAGNNIATTETLTNGSWGAATLTGGSFGTSFERSMGSVNTVAGSTTTVLQVDNLGSAFLIDELRGLKVTVSGESRIVVQNTASTITLNYALSSAPSAATAVALSVAEDSVESPIQPQLRVHPGQQPGENVMLAFLINTLQTAVVAYVLPT